MKSDYIRIRVTTQEKELLKEKAESADMSMTDYIKFCCLISPPSNRDEKKKQKANLL